MTFQKILRNFLFFRFFVIFNLPTFALFCIFLFLNKLSFVSLKLVAISLPIHFNIRLLSFAKMQKYTIPLPEMFKKSLFISSLELNPPQTSRGWE